VVLFLGPLTPALFIGLWRGWRVTISSRPALQTSSKKGGNDAQS
jgi:hypothetical protein